MQFLNNILANFFQLVHGFIRVFTTNDNVSYGLAIILFTIIIRILLLPLNIKQTRSQAKMQEIQPEIKKLQEKYKKQLLGGIFCGYLTRSYHFFLHRYSASVTRFRKPPRIITL